jgi:spore germination protein GerM
MTVARGAMIVTLLALVLISGCRRSVREPGDLEAENRVSSRSVVLYFESESMRLAPEQRELALPEKAAAAIPIVVRELLQGPRDQRLARTFPEGVGMRGAFSLPDGTAVIDFSSPEGIEHWSIGSHAELMAVYSVVETLTQNFKEVDRVRFVVNGQPSETFAGHVRVDQALTPLHSLRESVE